MDRNDILGMTDGEILALAAQFGDEAVVPYETLLTVMVTTERIALCKKLLEAGLSPDVAPGGSDSMELCIELNETCKMEMLAVLLEYSAYSISDQHGSGYTLLHIAASCHEIDAAKFLIARGASMYNMDIDCDRVMDYDLPVNEKDELLRYESMLRRV